MFLPTLYKDVAEEIISVRSKMPVNRSGSRELPVLKFHLLIKERISESFSLSAIVNVNRCVVITQLLFVD